MQHRRMQPRSSSSFTPCNVEPGMKLKTLALFVVALCVLKVRRTLVPVLMKTAGAVPCPMPRKLWQVAFELPTDGPVTVHLKLVCGLKSLGLEETTLLTPADGCGWKGCLGALPLLVLRSVLLCRHVTTLLTEWLVQLMVSLAGATLRTAVVPMLRLFLAKRVADRPSVFVTGGSGMLAVGFGARVVTRPCVFGVGKCLEVC